MMDDVLPGNMISTAGRRMPMHFFTFDTPRQPAAAFRFDLDPRQTNGTTYLLDAGGWNMPFKILRSSAAPKPILMLLHGMGLHPASFRGLAGHLLSTCDVILVDYTSFTAPDSCAFWPDGGASLRMLAHAVMRVVPALGLEKINIGGSSLGGGLSLMAAVDFPECIDRIVLFNPAIFPQRLPSFYRLVRVPVLGPLVMRFIAPDDLVCGVTTIGYVDPARVDQELVAVYRRNMQPAGSRRRLLDLIRRLPDHDGEVRHYLQHTGKLPRKVLIIWGEQDKLLAAGTGERLARSLPHNTFHNFPDLSHLPHEEAPDRIGPIVADFLADK